MNRQLLEAIYPQFFFGTPNRGKQENMIRNHTKKINLFENASDKVKDAEVKTFIDNALPRLRNYLDSAKAIQKGL